MSRLAAFIAYAIQPHLGALPAGVVASSEA